MTSTLTYTAPDISCGHCVATVEGTLKQLDGVSRVAASAETKQVEVEIDPACVSPQQIEAALDDAGYPVAKSRKPAHTDVGPGRPHGRPGLVCPASGPRWIATLRAGHPRREGPSRWSSHPRRSGPSRSA